jgi:hypothetical protein
MLEVAKMKLSGRTQLIRATEQQKCRKFISDYRNILSRFIKLGASPVLA